MADEVVVAATAPERATAAQAARTAVRIRRSRIKMDMMHLLRWKMAHRTGRRASVWEGADRYLRTGAPPGHDEEVSASQRRTTQLYVQARLFTALVAGLLAQPMSRTVYGMLTGTGLARVWHHCRAHRFFSTTR